jgi:hypothetical protein
MGLHIRQQRSSLGARLACRYLLPRSLCAMTLEAERDRRSAPGKVHFQTRLSWASLPQLRR